MLIAQHSRPRRVSTLPRRTSRGACFTPTPRRRKPALVVIRNPKDVLLSGLDYQRLIGLQERDVSDLDYARAFILHGGDMSWIARGYGTLEDNVHSWTSGLLKTGSAGAIGDLPPRLLVRYERLEG
jgi:hypothetical protein